MRELWIVCVGVIVVLSGCDTPTVGFSYDKTGRIDIGKNRFLVYYSDKQAQAIRLNNQSLRGLKGTMADGGAAIEAVTGCKITALHAKSDTVLTRASLRC
ncbi:hypothetical protein [Neptunicoccus cionae]|nr:hypothetical protein [Amylibacter cionae]